MFRQAHVQVSLNLAADLAFLCLSRDNCSTSTASAATPLRPTAPSRCSPASCFPAPPSTPRRGGPLQLAPSRSLHGSFRSRSLFVSCFRRCCQPYADAWLRLLCKPLTVMAVLLLFFQKMSACTAPALLHGFSAVPDHMIRAVLPHDRSWAH